MQRVTIGGIVREHCRSFSTRPTPHWTSSSVADTPVET
jgi:hypothetical protein